VLTSHVLAVWTGHDTRLVLYALIAIAGVIALITLPLRLHAFIALLIGAIFMGLAAGLGPEKTIESLQDGVGSTLGNVGVVLALGTMLGKLLAESGGAAQIAETVLSRSGEKRVPWAMALIAMIIGIPLFFEIGVVLLLPIIFTVALRIARPPIAGGATEFAAESGAGTATRGLGASPVWLLVGIPALAGLSVLHGLVPPHPGPLIAIDAVKADLGVTLLYGLIIAIPTVIVSGPLFARLAVRWAKADPPPDLVEQITSDLSGGRRPSFGATLFTILLPVVLMLMRTVAAVSLDEGTTVRNWAEFIGEPIVALIIAVLVAMYTFGFHQGFNGRKVSEFMAASLAPAAGILLIIGAGGGFKQVLIDSGIGEAIAKGAQTFSISALVLAWVVAVMIRLATGSATVATVTAAGIMAPLVANDPNINRELLVLAIGCGSLFFSHVNDAGFWMVKEFFGMTVADTIKSWSVMETLISVIGFALVLVASGIV
jgi:gluconate:H+ symporter, GntP family